MKTQTLVNRYAQDIKGVIECFDRVVLFGTYKAIGWTGAMEQHLRGRGTSFTEFNKSYANELRLEVADPGHRRDHAIGKAAGTAAGLVEQAGGQRGVGGQKRFGMREDLPRDGFGGRIQRPAQ